MTPLQIEILMHYVTRGDDYRNGDHSAPAVSEAISYFLEAGLLEVTRGKPYFLAMYKATDGAQMYVETLCKVPVPVKKTVWVMPLPKLGNADD